MKEVGSSVVPLQDQVDEEMVPEDPHNIEVLVVRPLGQCPQSRNEIGGLLGQTTPYQSYRYKSCTCPGCTENHGSATAGKSRQSV